MNTVTNDTSIRNIKRDFTNAMLLLEIEGFARHGFTDEQIADKLKVDIKAFTKLTRKKPKVN
jgi:uncharacterized protein YpbB